MENWRPALRTRRVVAPLGGRDARLSTGFERAASADSGSFRLTAVAAHTQYGPIMPAIWRDVGNFLSSTSLLSSIVSRYFSPVPVLKSTTRSS